MVWTSVITLTLLLSGCGLHRPPAPAPTAAPARGSAFVQVAVGEAHVCATTAAGDLTCWGAHHLGQLGLPEVPLLDARGLGTRSWAPRLVDLGAVTVLDVVAAMSHTCARFRAGRERRAACWGEGSAVPQDLGLDDVAAISTGTAHVCAHRGRREVACFAWVDGSGTLQALSDAEVRALETSFTPRGDWGCDVVPDGSVRCWADGPASWRLDDEPTRTWRFGVDCPEDTRPSWTADAWICLDAAGRRQGPSVAFWPDGRTRAEGAWRDDQRVGPWTERDELGRLRTSGSYVADERDGVWEVHRRPFALPEQRIAEGRYAAGVRVGRWTFEGGQAVTYDDAGQPIGWTLGPWRIERDDQGGWWRTHHSDDGSVLARSGVQPPTHRPSWGLDDLRGVPLAVLHGAYQGRHGDITVTGALVDGRPHGPWRGTRDSGPAWAGSFVDGRPDGLWQVWHPDGSTIARTGTFVGGLPDGRWAWWHPNGAPMAEGRYVHGRLVGRWRWLAPDGTVRRQRDFVAPTERSGEGLIGSLNPRWDAESGERLPPLEISVVGVPCGTRPDPPRDPRTRPGNTLMDEVDGLVDIEPLLDGSGVEEARSAARNAPRPPPPAPYRPRPRPGPRPPAPR